MQTVFRAFSPAFAAAALGLSLGLGSCGTHALDAAEAPRHAPTSPGMSGTIRFDAHVLVDQFGYRPDDVKVAVIRNPHVGYDRNDPFTPGSSYQVRNASDGKVVFAGTPQAWRSGQVEASSGDSGWWFDFGAVKTQGTYFVYDAQRNVRSATFNIAPDVYQAVLKAAVRMFYYQRSSFAKKTPQAQACWIDDAAYVSPGQDTQARDVTDRENRSKIRNLAGGWFDAGDTNKYVTFAATAVHQLLTAFQENHAAFTDDFGIPESGNGVPDILDEVHWETDWLQRMQYPDGSSALKVGEIVDATGTRPGLDSNPRYYVPGCTSATIAAAGMFAHAALVYGPVAALHDDSSRLTLRATAAWDNYQHTPKQTSCDSGAVKAGNADWSAGDQDSAAVVAAIYLFALTGQDTFNEYVRTHYRQTRPYRDAGWTRYNPEQGEALLYYATLANANPEIKTAILADKARDAAGARQIYGFHPDDDLYRAFMHDEQYHWGSNGPRANYGNSNIDMLTYNIAAAPGDDYRLRALELLHYFHGVNPFGMVYLSNMYAYGATRSANEIYHTWFWHGSRWSNALASECGPAPGFVPGGPNADALKNGVPASIAPPTGQPLQKSYKDWNAAWPESSWAVTEPGIYYQAAYVELLSKFAR